MTDNEDSMTAEVFLYCSLNFPDGYATSYYMQNAQSQASNTQNRKKSFPVNTTFSDSFQVIPALKKSTSLAEIRRIAREEHIQAVTTPSE